MKTRIEDFEDFDHYNIVWNTKTQQYDKIPKTVKAISKEKLFEIKKQCEDLRAFIDEYKETIFNCIKK